MQTDLETLRRVVIETTKKSAVGEKVEDVALEPAQHSEGDEYLRVMIRLKNIDEAGSSSRLKTPLARLMKDIPACASRTLLMPTYDEGLLEAADASQRPAANGAPRTIAGLRTLQMKIAAPSILSASRSLVSLLLQNKDGRVDRPAAEYRIVPLRPS